MWNGVLPAVTTKFTADDQLDHAEMERCFGLQMDAGVDGLIVCGSLGEGPMLSHDEKLDVLATARKVAGRKPVLLTINEAGTREAASLARRALYTSAQASLLKMRNPSFTPITTSTMPSVSSSQLSLPRQTRQLITLLSSWACMLCAISRQSISCLPITTLIQRSSRTCVKLRASSPLIPNCSCLPDSISVSFTCAPHTS